MWRVRNPWNAWIYVKNTYSFLRIIPSVYCFIYTYYKYSFLSLYMLSVSKFCSLFPKFTLFTWSFASCTNATYIELREEKKRCNNFFSYITSGTLSKQSAYFDISRVQTRNFKLDSTNNVVPLAIWANGLCQKRCNFEKTMKMGQ